ncbi:hypothetical protein SLE2022_334760 [Rubroshorea leprosula]
MDTKKFLLFKNSYFVFLLASMNEFFFINMSRALGFFWVFVSKFIFRLQGNENCANESGFDVFKEKQSIESTDNEHRDRENGLMAASSKYEFSGRADISGFIEEPKTEGFTLLEFYRGSGDIAESAQTNSPEHKLGRDNRVNGETGSLVESHVFGKITEEQEKEANTVFEGKTEDSVEEEAGDSVEKEAGDSIESFVIEKKLRKKEHRIGEDDPVEDQRSENSVQGMEKHEEENEEKRDVVEVKTEASVLTSSINSDDQVTFSPGNSNENVEMDECVESNPQVENSSIANEGSDDDEDDSPEVQQLKMQFKLARTGGLPTISEDSEFSKMIEELQPLKIDVKLDHIADIQKVYKSYSDRMRKLDILNSQTKHAISLLQLNDPVRIIAKSSAMATSLLTKNIWPFKQQRPETDRTVKLIRDLHRDLEIVYVGQTCLSWEILCWQHGKLQELLQHDAQGIHRFIDVTAEFQFFQVLVHRFLENEPFQGMPRVENYVKSRYLLPKFLQVPKIKGNKGTRVEEEDASAMLTEIVEESMQVFWEFLRADKDETSLSLKGPQQRQVAPQDPLDLGLLMEVQRHLQNKEKRLKEIMRITNCIVNKLQKQQRTALDHAVFIAQVELKLVSRVLNMSKLTTDHLVWCHEKLEKMRFRSRKLEIEPSMLLFPC